MFVSGEHFQPSVGDEFRSSLRVGQWHARVVFALHEQYGHGQFGQFLQQAAYWFTAADFAYLEGLEGFARVFLQRDSAHFLHHFGRDVPRVADERGGHHLSRQPAVGEQAVAPTVQGRAGIPCAETVQRYMAADAPRRE